MTLEKFVKEKGFPKIKHVTKWNDFDVYVPVEEELLFDGLPMFILVDEEEIRFSTEGETVKIVEFMEGESWKK